MINKIVISGMISFFGIFFSSVSFAQSITSYLSYTGGNYTTCYKDAFLTLVWKKSTIPTGQGEWLGDVQTRYYEPVTSGAFIVYAPKFDNCMSKNYITYGRNTVGDVIGFFYPGTCADSGEPFVSKSHYIPNTCAASLSTLPPPPPDVISYFSMRRFYVCDYYLPPGVAVSDGYSKGILTCSNYALFYDPSKAPIGNGSGPYARAVLTPPGKMTLTKDPINIATGEIYLSSVDFSSGARGPKLALTRKYRSFSSSTGMFGYGWRTDYDVNLSTDSSEDVIIYDYSGTGSYFMKVGSYYIPSPGNYSALTKNTDGTYSLRDKHGIVTNYDTNGRLKKRTDRNGNTLTFVYNPAVAGGSYIQDANGRQIKLTFDASKRVISATDPAGNTFQYAYDTSGNLVKVTDPQGGVATYVYDANHKVTKLTNAKGQNTYYQYDAQGRAIMNWQDNNVNKITLSYQSNNKTVTTDGLGNINTYVFDNAGLLLSHTDPLGAVIQETWDLVMNLAWRLDGLGRTDYYYDEKGNVTSITDEMGRNTIRMAYSSDFSLVTTIADVNYKLTTLVYDTKGNLTTTTDSLGKSTLFAYDVYGNLVKTTDRNGKSANFVFDLNGRVTQKTDALGNIFLYTYDANGNLITQKNARNFVTSFQYDKLNRLTKITYPNGTMASYGYDLIGNQITVTDQRGKTLTNTFDAYNRLAQTTDAKGGVVKFSYDTEGRLLSVMDPRGNSVNYTYDANGRKLTEKNALNFITKFTYDPLGNILSKTDANGILIQYTYDDLSRVTIITYPDNTQIRNNFDWAGRNTSVSDPAGGMSYVYDDLDRLTSKSGPFSVTYGSINYTYDNEGNRLTQTDQNNRTIVYSYDALNRLISVKDNMNITTYGYDANSNLTLIKSPNGVTQTYTYDSLNRVLSVVSKTSAGTVISSFTNLYDVAGMIIQKTYKDGSFTNYTYDELNRLLTERNQKGSIIVYDYAFQYDASGNRLSWAKHTTLGGIWSISSSLPPKVLANMTAAGFGTSANQAQSASITKNYTYDAANRLISWSNAVNVATSSFPFETITYVYDNNGNRTLKKKVRLGQESVPQVTAYTYDFENRLNTVTYTNIPGITGTQTDTFVYTVDGRVKAVRNNITTSYLRDGLNVLLEKDGSSATTKSYIRGLSSQGGIGSLISQKNASGVSEFYDYNDLRSTADLTTSTGSVSHSYIYDAFGNLLASISSSDTNRFLFTTKEFETRSGLYYFGARYYDPEVGRWLTLDPMGYSDGINLYRFSRNNPVNFVDPYGFTSIEGAIFGAGFGGYTGFVTGLYRGGVKGAVVGLFTGAGAGAVVGFFVPDSPMLGTLAGAVGSATANVLSNFSQGQSTLQEGAFNNTTFSLASGALFGGASSAMLVDLAAEGAFGANMATGLILTPLSVGADMVDYALDPNGTSLDGRIANLIRFGANNFSGKERK